MWKQKQVDSRPGEPDDWWGKPIAAGERVAVVLDHGPPMWPVIAPPERIEDVAACWTLADDGDKDSVPRQHFGFGVFPGGPGGRACLPMRLEFQRLQIDAPIEAVFDLDHGLIGRYEFRMGDDGTIRFVRLEVVPSKDAEPDTDPLRRLNLGVIREQLNAWLCHPFVAANLGTVLAVPRRRPGRRGSDPLEFAVWAARYVRALKVDARRPARVIVDQAAENGEHVTLKQVNNAVRRARSADLNLLTASPPGKAGGELTENAERILRDGRMGHLIDEPNEGAH